MRWLRRDFLRAVGVSFGALLFGRSPSKRIQAPLPAPLPIDPASLRHIHVQVPVFPSLPSADPQSAYLEFGSSELGRAGVENLTLQESLRRDYDVLFQARRDKNSWRSVPEWDQTGFERAFLEQQEASTEDQVALGKFWGHSYEESDIPDREGVDSFSDRLPSKGRGGSLPMP